MFHRIKTLLNPPLNPARVGLLRGRVRQRSERRPVRPPWALEEFDFLQLCSRCDACIRTCSDHLLVRGEGGFPEANFSAAHCNFCGDCVAVCETRALRKTDVQGINAQSEERVPWQLWPQVSAACLLHKQVACRSCGDVCVVAAIHFTLVPGRGGIPQMHIQSEVCTGCGACVAACPAQAITLLHVDAAAP